MRSLGICFTGQPYSVREVVQAARQAEDAGFDSVWVAEDAWTGRDAVTVLTAVALKTSRIRVGSCLVGAGSRHPVLTAMTFNVLREIAPGRVVLGIGYADGWRPTLTTQVAEKDESPLRTMREAVTAMRSLLDGGSATWGKGQRQMVIDRPWFEPMNRPLGATVPIYMGAVGPRMTRLAGEVADGLLLEMESLREFLPERIDAFRAGAIGAGKDPATMATVKLILASVGPDASTVGGRAMHHNALGWAAKSVSLMSDAAALRLGWDGDRVSRIRSEWESGNWEVGKAAMTPEMNRAVVAVGPEDEVIQIVQETAAAGVSVPVLIPYGGDVSSVIAAGKKYVRGG